MAHGPAATDDAERWARLAALGQRIVAGLDERVAEQAVVDAAVELLGADAGGYARVGSGAAVLELRAMASVPAVARRMPPIGTDLAIDLASMDEPLMGQEPFRVTDASTAPAAIRAVLRRIGLTSAATVLVGRLDRPFGLLGVATSEARVYSEVDIAIVQALGNLLAGALERAEAERAVAERIREQEALADLGTRVIAGLGVADLAREIVAALAERRDVDAVAVLRVRADDSGYELVAGRGVKQSVIDRAPLGPRTIGAATIAADEPVIVADLRDRTSTLTSPLADRLGLSSVVLARIGDRDAPWGLLGIGADRPRLYGADDAALVRGHANLLASAVALERATSAIADQARHIEEIRFEERTALAREIHDGLVQDLWLARLHHDLLAEAVGRGADIETRLAELGAAVDRAGESARQAVITLRAGQRERTSLAGDLATYAADVGRRLGIHVETHTGAELPDLPARVQAELLRIVQEVLTNAARHARPSRVGLETAIDRRGLRIAIHDDGRGFDPERVPPGAVGLAGMRERAGLIGASIAIQSRPGRGTTVVITLPRRAWGRP